MLRKLISDDEGNACWLYLDGSHRGIYQEDCNLINKLIEKELTNKATPDK